MVYFLEWPCSVLYSQIYFLVLFELVCLAFVSSGWFDLTLPWFGQYMSGYV
jgi:hypothetical protein